MRIWIVMATLTFAAGCGNDDGGPIPPPPDNCLEPSFTAIQAVFASGCSAQGCHGGPNGQSNFISDATKDEVHAALVGVATANAQGSPTFPLRVEAGSSATSSLVHLLSPDPSFAFRMGALQDCEIDAVRAWIDAGAANN